MRPTISPLRNHLATLEIVAAHNDSKAASEPVLQEINLMSSIDVLKDLLSELDHTHTQAFYESDAFRSELGIPDFVTTTSGDQRSFYRESRKHLAKVTAWIYEQSAFNKRIDAKRFSALVRQTVADLHASDAFGERSNPLPILTAELNRRVDSTATIYVHSFPAWTCGVERGGEWKMGPVTFLTWPQWLSHVDFHDDAKANFLNEPEANAQWKSLLLEAMEKPNSDAPKGMASLMLSTVRSCPAVLRIAIGGLDQGFSRKFGEIICKAALDAVSLLIGQRQAFVQQALQVERLPPVAFDSLIETNGYLWHPGSTLTERVPNLSGQRLRAYLSESKDCIKALEHALNGLWMPSTHPHPQLSSRWATALDWYAEGQRERSDAIALAKIGTSLDVLCSGGKYRGILGMLTNLMGVPENATFTRGTKQTTLSSVVKEIYDRGRSQILHGNRHDRMEAFEADRNAASYLARLALIEAALRLEVFTGPDDSIAFRTMPPRTPPGSASGPGA